MIRTTLALALTFVVSIGFTGTAIADTTHMAGGTDVFQVDLASGTLTPLGTIGEGETVIALALDTTTDVAGPAWAVTADGHLLQFDVGDPGTIASSVAIAGVEDGDWLAGIDVRPATGELMGLSAWGVVYSIDVETGSATAVGAALDPALESDSLGFDFNPTVDRIRVDVSTTQNLRLNPETGTIGTNPDTGEPTIDGNLAFAPDDASADTTPMVVGAGYTNSVDGAEETVLYVIDAATNSLAIQDPPNDGTLNTIGQLSEMVNAHTSFDIAPDGTAILTIPDWEEPTATPQN